MIRDGPGYADVGSLGSLAAGVGVDLGVEYEHVDILAGCEHVIESAISDVVCPTVATEDPEGLLGQEDLVLKHGSCLLASCLRENLKLGDIGIGSLG